jgi:hypothetical protein
MIPIDTFSKHTVVAEHQLRIALAVALDDGNSPLLRHFIDRLDLLYVRFRNEVVADVGLPCYCPPADQALVFVKDALAVERHGGSVVAVVAAGVGVSRFGEAMRDRPTSLACRVTRASEVRRTEGRRAAIFTKK